jgi:hypothetical protein
VARAALDAKVAEMSYPKTPIDQTQEIERLVADVLEMLDQVRYSLQTLEVRLKEQSHKAGEEPDQPGPRSAEAS